MINGILFQFFEWYLPADGRHWQRLAEEAAGLAAKGVTAIWIPPAYKGTSDQDTGYSCYDLYDLGEFDQKGTVRSKYGTKDELLRAVETVHSCGMSVYADVVLNHKAGADQTEFFQAVEVNPQNRLEELGEAHEIEGWTSFTFPGRAGKYSGFTWNFNHFSGVDFDQRSGKQAIYRILGENKSWSEEVSHEFGNFDYLMHADINHSHPEVRDELIRWAKWFARELHLDGFRLDAVKHISAGFMRELSEEIRAEFGERFYLVAEYWQNSDAETLEYIQKTNFRLDLFDVPLHYHMMQAGEQGAGYDLRTIFDQTVLSAYPAEAVTFVENHDTQPGQALQSPVADWFKPSAYCLILLREAGYPCVFYGDYYGSSGGEQELFSFRQLIDKLLLLRRHYARGRQTDYFEEFEAIGWVRQDEDNHTALAVIMTTQEERQELRMFVGEDAAGKIYADFLGNLDDKIQIDKEGFGLFPVREKSVSCWLPDGLPLQDLPLPERP